MIRGESGMKRITAFVCLLIIFLSCFGCKASQENQTDTHGDTEYNPVISLKEQDSEAQPYWSNTDNCVAKGDGGYYYSTGTLYFFRHPALKINSFVFKAGLYTQ